MTATTPGQAVSCAYCEDDPDHPDPDNADTCTCLSPGCGRGWCPQRDDLRELPDRAATPGQANEIAGSPSPELRAAILGIVQELVACESDLDDKCPRCKQHTDEILAAVAAQEPQPAPLSALGGRSGELTVDEVQELRGKLEASLAQSARQPKPAPDLGTAWRLLDEARAALRELSGRMTALAGEWVADAEHDETRVRPTVISDARARTLRECADELRKRAAEVTDGTHA